MLSVVIMVQRYAGLCINSLCYAGKKNVKYDTGSWWTLPHLAPSVRARMGCAFHLGN